LLRGLVELTPLAGVNHVLYVLVHFRPEVQLSGCFCRLRDSCV
jgi:hypothetical protein